MSVEKIYVAIDTPDLEKATQWARTIGPVTGGIKIGLEFFNRHGPQGVKQVAEACPAARVFVDLKYHDIPNTVAGAVRSLSENIKPAYLNVHAAGGTEMMRRAREACHPETRLLAVTILTSLNGDELCKIGYKEGMKDRVRDMALLAREAGLDGVVCSAHEIEMLREACGPDFALMVPGIRPAGADHGDQARVMTPQDALAKGATHLVIGRPITQADDPHAAAKEIIKSLI
jgi:orotidine-5'-phosphate decarboxylase